ncbi:GNAT family N-acetyltransferase [Pseudokineococcus sp. 1T1Z-3]|uniref:GNAT family N-acetyltransferase n=1 Tax=Pseudokineococcus sp. 1T1Z-3 TaxID=3132745 RepID=UPI00309AC87D
MDDDVIRGARVRLRPITREDRDAVVAMRRTPEVHRRWRGDDVAAEVDADLADPARHLVVTTDDGRVVGLVQDGEEEDTDYRSASVDLFVDPAMHRRGYGSDAVRTLCDHLFDERGHHRVTIDPAVDDEAAIACYARVGFRPVGVLRAYERQSDGTWADGLLMELLATDRPGPG